MTDKKSNTEYYRFKGKLAWAKIYEPDEFRGAVNWLVNFYPDNAEEWALIKKSGIQARPKDDDGEKSGIKGRYIPLKRPTFKMMKGNGVYFTAPRVMDKDGSTLIRYVDEHGKEVRTYTDKNQVIRREGDVIGIGNGSEAYVYVVTYPTGMGIGNRLESIQLIDLIEYSAPENTRVIHSTDDLDDEIPF